MPPLIESGSDDGGGCGVDREDDDDSTDDDDQEKVTTAVASVPNTSDRNGSPVHRSPSPASACHSLEWDSNGDDFLAADCRQLPCYQLRQPISAMYGTQGNWKAQKNWHPPRSKSIVIETHKNIKKSSSWMRWKTTTLCVCLGITHHHVFQRRSYLRSIYSLSLSLALIPFFFFLFFSFSLEWYSSGIQWKRCTDFLAGRDQ